MCVCSSQHRDKLCLRKRSERKVNIHHFYTWKLFRYVQKTHDIWLDRLYIILLLVTVEPLLSWISRLIIPQYSLLTPRQLHRTLFPGDTLSDVALRPKDSNFRFQQEEENGELAVNGFLLAPKRSKTTKHLHGICFFCLAAVRRW